MSNLPKFSSLLPVFFDEPVAIRFLFDSNIVKTVFTCDICNLDLILDFKGERFRHVCINGRVEHSVWKGTFFSKIRIRKCEILHLAYLWLSGCTHKTAMVHTGHSKPTITDYYSHFNQLVAEDLNEEDLQIGGENIVVEVDETKLGKRKYHRGHHVDGVWVVVGVERTPNRKIFVIMVENRDSYTLAGIINRFVLPGSIVHTDCWRGYSNLSDNSSIIHRTVNHSEGFIDMDSGVHTNTVEGTNFALKRFIPIRNRTRSDLGDLIFKFIWFGQHDSDLWNGFLLALKNIVY
jgi:transposase-like protein